jgi:hypothetical protein
MKIDAFCTNGSSPPLAPTSLRPPLRGVAWDRQRHRWRARIVVPRTTLHPRLLLHIGWFQSELEAAVAHDLAALYFNEARSVKTNGAAVAYLDVAAQVAPRVVDRIIALEEPALAAGVTPVPRPDMIVEDHGSIFILRGMSDAGYAWIEEHVSREGHQPFGLGARLVEPRYVSDIVNGATSDGLVVQGA